MNGLDYSPDLSTDGSDISQEKIDTREYSSIIFFDTLRMNYWNRLRNDNYEEWYISYEDLL
jgi:hypothetical protein